MVVSKTGVRQDETVVGLLTSSQHTAAEAGNDWRDGGEDQQMSGISAVVPSCDCQVQMAAGLLVRGEIIVNVALLCVREICKKKII